MSRPTTVVSLLVWDSPVYTRNLLANLDWAVPGHDFHLRILDQGSQPETRELVRSFVSSHSRTTGEILSGNIGYGAGHNRNFAMMARKMDFDYFITINSDVVFGEPGWIDMMVDAMEAAPDAALGGPFAYFEKPGVITPATRAQRLGGEFMFITGAVCIIRAATVRQLGLFDEEYTPAYWEDADMAERYRHFGWRQIHIDVPVVHGYLGDAGRVNVEKRAQLDEQWGDFKKRNLHLFFDRWRFRRIEPPQRVEDLRRVYPSLYIPETAAAAP